MKYFVLMLAIFTLSACDAMQQNGARAGGNITQAYNNTRYKVSRYIYGEKPVEQAQAYVAPPLATFCYQAQFDVMCYDRPKPELHLNLIAVHGENNYAYDDFLPSNVRGGNISSGNFGSSDAGNDYGSAAQQGSASSIMMSDLSGGRAGGGAATNVDINGGRKSPFYYSPSPATSDPFGDADVARSKYLP